MYDAMDNAARNRGKQALVADLVRRLSNRSPLIVLIEDIHWADGVVLAHVASLAAAVADCGALLVLTSRLEGDPLDQAWRAQTHGSPLMTIDLSPLRENEALALAGEYLEATSRFAQSCVERAEGNPLFLDQLLRSAEETSEDAVPGSVQSIVLARMDNLDPLDRLAVQAASVIGQRFSLDLLRDLIESEQYAADPLVAHYLVRPDDADFLFAHALIRDSVYSSLLTGRKRELHGRAAAWFAEHDPVLRAEHLDRAEDSAAAQAYLEAADVQAELFHFERALRLVERGLEVAQEAADRYRLLMRQGECLREMGQPARSIDIYQRALTEADSDIENCRAWIGLAAGMRVTDDYDAALQLLEQAESVARERGLERELSQVHYYRGNLYFPLGNIEGCLEQHRLALDYAERAQSPECQVRALSGLGDGSIPTAG